jgi:hypothetical protein
MLECAAKEFALLSAGSSANETKGVPSRPSSSNDRESKEASAFTNGKVNDGLIFGVWLVQRICEVVRDHAVEVEDISFKQFVKHMPVCEWLTQRARLVLWLNHISRSSSSHASASRSLRFPFLDSFDNLQSLSLLPLILSGSKDTFTPEALTITSRPDWYLAHAGYTYVGGDRSIRSDDLLIQQAANGNELNWSILESSGDAARLTFDFVMTLARIYHQPIKFLSVIGAQRLFTLMDGVISLKYIDIFRTLAFRLSDSNINGHIGSASTPVRHTISVLKWVLRKSESVWNIASNGHRPIKLEFGPADFNDLLDLHLQISVPRSQNSQVSLMVDAMIMSLDGPPDVIYYQTGVKLRFLSTGPLSESPTLNTLPPKYVS